MLSKKATVLLLVEGCVQKDGIEINELERETRKGLARSIKVHREESEGVVRKRASRGNLRKKKI